MRKQASEEKGKLEVKAALVFACVMTLIAEVALALMFRVPNSSFWSDYFEILAKLSAPGVLVGFFVAGGGNPAVILLVASPINLGFYTGLALGVMKIFQRISRTRRRGIEA